MKHYIILTPSIGNMGGSEMFTYNKTNYLKKNGWTVSVYYFCKSDTILLPLLDEYKKNYIPDLQYGVWYYTNRERDRIISIITKNIQPGDEVVVEGHMFLLCLWGELVAKRIKGLNILNCIEEKISASNISDFSFLEFKLKRSEILNCDPKSLVRYFKSYNKNEYLKYTHDFFKIICTNVTSDVASGLILDNADYNILSIGRLDKPYILPTFQSLQKFVEQVPQSTINLIIVGGSPDNSQEKKIEKMYRDCENVKMHFLGYLYPIPSDLVLRSDVCIASSNSILVSSDLGVPTIAVDANDYYAMGVYGYTTQNRLARTVEAKIEVSDLLHDVLIERKFTKKQPDSNRKNDELDESFDLQIKFLNFTQRERKYFDVVKQRSLIERACLVVKRHVACILGKWETNKIN